MSRATRPSIRSCPPALRYQSGLGNECSSEAVEGAPPVGRNSRSKLDPFKPYLDQRTGEGCGNGAQLFREIRERSYAGSYCVVRGYLDRKRPARAGYPRPLARSARSPRC